MAQRNVESLIGRLVTDQALREAYLSNASHVVKMFCETGHELTALEISALLATPSDLWSEAAKKIDPRLQKAKRAVIPEASHERKSSRSNEAAVQDREE